MTTATAILVTAEKRLALVAVSELAHYQACVGGLIDVVRLDDGHDIIINDEGKLNGLPYNPIATDLAILGGGIDPLDYVAGDVLITGPLANGESTDADADSQTIENLALIAHALGATWITEASQ